MRGVRTWLLRRHPTVSVGGREFICRLTDDADHVHGIARDDTSVLKRNHYCGHIIQRVELIAINIVSILSHPVSLTCLNIILPSISMPRMGSSPFKLSRYSFVEISIFAA